jgi:hypothetical protein
MTDFGADESFASSVKKLKEHYGIEAPESAVRQTTQRHGQIMLESEQLQQRLPDGGVELLIAEMDGSMVPIVSIAEPEDVDSTEDKRKLRKLDWKEARLAMVRRPEEVSKLYNATMAGVERAGEQLLDLVIEQGGGKQTRIHCLGDGAAWIVGQVKEKFGEQASYLVDFYHMSGYLAAAAKPIAGAQEQGWLRQQQQRMKEMSSDFRIPYLLDAFRPYLLGPMIGGWDEANSRIATA